MRICHLTIYLAFYPHLSKPIGICTFVALKTELELEIEIHVAPFELPPQQQLKSNQLKKRAIAKSNLTLSLSQTDSCPKGARERQHSGTKWWQAGAKEVAAALSVGILNAK